jgi:CBS domain-containing protein
VAGEFTPSAQLVDQLSTELRRHAPFAQMRLADVKDFVGNARQTYHAPGERVASPDDGPAPTLYVVRRGAVSASGGVADITEGGIHYEAGDLFPAAAVAGERAVSATYEAVEDLFCLEVSAAYARELAGRSAAWADFLARRAQHLLELARSALQAAEGAQALAEHSLESPLARLPRRGAVACAPGTPLMAALRLMHERRVGSVLVVDAEDRALGILTRHDVLERVALRRPPEDTPIEQVMSQPLTTLDIGASAQDAALLMSRHGIRHLPLTENGRVVSVVSERDLFALQRLSLRHVSGLIRAAAEPAALVDAGAAIRKLARHLLTQGLSARALTDMLSHLNDLLTERLVQLLTNQHGLDPSRATWVAFGSEGRAEQTIATDQDNGLVLDDSIQEAERERWLAFARDANRALDACGYPLCKGNVMASNPQCCLTAGGWLARFEQWMERGTPEDLLNASIYFDLRALGDGAERVAPLRARVAERARELPRFRKQLADNALRMRVALNWRGALDAQEHDGHAWLDLKMGGTAIFVDAARLFALAHGITAHSTRQRLEQSAAAMRAPAAEAADWVSAFEALQMMRLRQQVHRHDAEHPNRVDVNQLPAIDRRLLKEALRVARVLQQRIELDYPG